MLLYMAARAQLVEQVIRPALAGERRSSPTVFCLRMWYTKGTRADWMSTNYGESARLRPEGIKPDLTFLLDIDPQAATHRIRREPDRMESQGDEFRRRLRDGFLAEAARRPDRIRRINADQSIEAMQADIRRAAEGFAGS